MPFFVQLFQGVSQAWRRLSLSARVNLGVASVITVLLVAGVVLFQTRPHYVPLYTGLDLGESAEIQSYLAEQGIPFDLADGGRTIRVPIEDRSSARVELAQQNLPTQQGKGFELFDQQSLLTNDYQQNIQYQRALAGELMRQLNQFDFVKRSSAYISMPREPLFADEEVPVRAAVTLDARRDLTREEIKGVLQIISAYGGGRLNPGNVTLMTHDGKTLHVPVEDSRAALASDKLDVVERLERQRQAKIESVLRPLVAQAVVSVSAEVDFSVERVTDTQVSDGIAIITDTRTSETTNEPVASGAPGVSSNPPDGVVPSAATITQDRTTEETVNVEPSVRTTEMTDEGPAITGWSVSVVVDMGDRQEVTDTEGQPTGEQEYIPLTDEKREMIKHVVAAAIGPSLPLDDVAVYDHPLIGVDKLPSAEAAFLDVRREITGFTLLESGILVGKMLLVLLALLAVRHFLKRAMVPMPAVAEDRVEMPAVTPEEVRKRQVAAEVERMSRESPEAMAAILRTWMSEAED